MEDNELTLEKLRVKERLATVEQYMATGELTRQTLIVGFSELKDSVKTMEMTLFGKQGELGLVHKMDAVIKVADGIKWVLTKIFLTLCATLAMAYLPAIFKFLGATLGKHTGG